MSASLDDLEGLYRSRFPEFLRVATALTGSVESGRDAVQEGFVKAVRSRADFRGQGTLGGWVWRAVVNSALSRQRRDGRAGLGEILRIFSGSAYIKHDRTG